MLARTKSSALLGVHALPIEVEAELRLGLPYFDLLGLSDQHARARVQAAIKNSGFELPQKKITVNLAPAGLRKDGASFDLPIALAILSAANLLPPAPEDVLFVGELGLDGRLRSIRGALPLAVSARDAGLRAIVVPRANAAEAAVVSDIEVLAVETLAEAAAFVSGEASPEPVRVAVDALFAQPHDSAHDLSDVQGQVHAKRALEIAAAGGHNILFIGPPGSGKTMLARRLSTLLPRLSFDEALETSTVYSVAGLLGERPLITERPFRAPHHTISDAGMIGGGSHPRPGEISLAHNGVLFLDELPEFKKHVIEALRQPLEDRHIHIARASGMLAYPAGFMLVAAMNPCPCGYATHPRRACVCGPGETQRYRARISGPLLDRIDLHVDVPAVPFEELSRSRTSETSATVRERVLRAREVQSERFAGLRIHCNAQMGTKLMRRHCVLSPPAEDLLRQVIDRFAMSARALDRILRVARTISDLDGEPQPSAGAVAEAIQYRALDRATSAGARPPTQHLTGGAQTP